MQLDFYQKKAMSTRMDSCDNPLYMVLEICSEAGELQGKLAKAIRRGDVVFDGNKIRYNFPSEDELNKWTEDVVHELGDVLWGIAGMADQLGYSLEDVAMANIEKLASRAKRGVISGSGDNR